MINFTNCKEELNNYKGSEKKKTLIYENKKYLVKFPDPIREKNKNISYINNAFSEYIGSNVFKIVGFPTQNTILGIYKYNEKEKIVCACEDFTDSSKTLYEFENLAFCCNNFISSFISFISFHISKYTDLRFIKQQTFLNPAFFMALKNIIVVCF